MDEEDFEGTLAKEALEKEMAELKVKLQAEKAKRCPSAPAMEDWKGRIEALKVRLKDLKP